MREKKSVLKISFVMFIVIALSCLMLLLKADIFQLQTVKTVKSGDSDSLNYEHKSESYTETDSEAPYIYNDTFNSKEKKSSSKEHLSAKSEEKVNGNIRGAPYRTNDNSNSTETFLSAIGEEKVNGNITLKHFLNSFHDSPRTVKIQSSTTKSNIKRNLPTFMIIGVQKASTTLLALYLQNHPDIIMSVRENHSYDSHYPTEKYQETHTVDKFIQTHQNKEFSKLCKLGGEYNSFQCGMRDPAAFFRPNLSIPLLKVFPWRIRFLLLLRDPVDRLESQLNMMKGKGQLKKYGQLTYDEIVKLDLDRMQEAGLIKDWNKTVAFKKFINSDREAQAWSEYQTHMYDGFVARGLYDLQIRNWMKHFPAEDILVVKNSELKNTPENIDVVNKTMNKLFKFLGVSQHNVKGIPKRLSNKATTNCIQRLMDNKNPKRNLNMKDGVSDALKKKLKEFYDAYNYRLNEFIIGSTTITTANHIYNN